MTLDRGMVLIKPDIVESDVDASIEMNSVPNERNSIEINSVPNERNSIDLLKVIEMGSGEKTERMGEKSSRVS